MLYTEIILTKKVSSYIMASFTVITNVNLFKKHYMRNGIKHEEVNDDSF